MGTLLAITLLHYFLKYQIKREDEKGEKREELLIK